MTATRRVVSLLSLAAFSALVLGYLWWGRFQYDHYLYLIATYAGAVGLVVINHVYHRDSRAETGFRLDNFRTATRTWGLLTLLGAGVILTVGFLLGSFRLDRLSDVYLYAVWAGLQQHLLQNFLRLRSKEVLGGSGTVAAILAAVLFAGYHLPNVPLVLASLAGGIVWCLLFSRVPSLVWSWLSQAVLVSLLILFMKYSFLEQFQVGKPGYRYDYYGQGVKVAGGYDGTGKPIVVTLPGPDRDTESRVRVFDVTGKLLKEWVAFPEYGFSGELAVGDVGFGAGDEIVVAPGPGGGNPSWLRIFDAQGRLLKEHRFQGGNFGAWVSIGCGRILLTPGPGPGTPQEIKEIDGHGKVLNSWSFEQLGWLNGIRASTHCTAADSKLLFLWASPIAVNPSAVVVYDTVTGQSRSLETFGTTFGLNAGMVQLGEGKVGLVVAPGPLKGYPPLIYVIGLDGRKIADFSVESDNEAYGCNVAAVDTDADGIDEIILGEGVGPGRPARVRVVRLSGAPLREWVAY